MLRKLKTQRFFDEKALSAVTPEYKTMERIAENAKRVKSVNANMKKTFEEGVAQFRETLREKKEEQEHAREKRRQVLRGEEQEVNEIRSKQKETKRRVAEQERRLEELREKNEKEQENRSN